MEDDLVDRTYDFHWRIENPFVPFRRMNATFFTGSPIPNTWKVALIPVDGELNRWHYNFRLTSIPTENSPVSAGRIELRIRVNDEPPEERVEDNFPFVIINRYTYEFRFTAWAFPRGFLLPVLIIDLSITFFEYNIWRQELSTFNLMQLSEDLWTLFNNSYFPDLTLTSEEDGLFHHPVHSYIIEARWNKFFSLHRGNPIANNVVALNISSDVLEEILMYIYSARLQIGNGRWGEEAFVTQVFKVIDRCDLHHLYNVIARTDLPQFRQTRKQMIITCVTCRLNDENNQRINNPSRESHINPNTDFYFVFRIQFFWTRAPFCLYSLESRSSRTIHAQVILMFITERRTRYGIHPDPPPYMMHRRDYEIARFETEESGACPLIVLPYFSDFLEGRGRYFRCRGMRIRHAIRCYIYTSDGTQVVQITNGDDVGYLNEEERMNILSDHMYSLFAAPSPHNDLFFNCRGPNNEENLRFAHFKGLFLARVRGWRTILNNLEEGNEIPLENEIRMTSVAFNLILYYICTGKVFPIPAQHIQEIERFAQDGQLANFENLRDRLRVAAQNM